MTFCLFCAIVAGRQAASVVYDDPWSLAFMNLRQANPGHVLVIPKAHVGQITGLTPEQAGRLFEAVVRVARAVTAAVAAEGLTVWQSNGAAAGQEVPHVHIHVLPRRPGDGLIGFYPAGAPPVQERAALDALAAALRSRIAAHADSS